LARKILLADDSVTAQNMGRKILADAGYEVTAVNNGSAALKKILELKPDLVILDVYMPGYSGLEVCQRLKESPETARIPVLLSVGKLEPFKPEESQRVRADGFIVKPFEASELLSALSKLEDKVVPRAEPSKPGRFARAMAAAEEADRGSKNTTGNEDNGWKSRIAFPKQKPEAEEKVADESPIYNQVNRDLRTMVDKPALGKETPRQPIAEAPEATVDVAALVPPNLPNDVTPEEVAAIAAAVAQMQMAAAAGFDVEKPGSEINASENLIPETGISETKISETKNETNFEPTPVPAEASVGPQAKTLEVEARKDVGITAAEAASAAFAERESDVPVTMAVTAESVGTAATRASCWTAVPVALDSEDAVISLEQEMQKGYAAFVAAEAEVAGSATMPEAQAAPAENSSARVEAAVVEVAAATISNLEPEPVAEPAPTIKSEPEVESMPAGQSETSSLAPSVVDTAPVSLPEPASTFSEPVAVAESIPSEAVPMRAEAEKSTAAEISQPHSEPVPVSEIPALAAATEVADSVVMQAQPSVEAEATTAEAGANGAATPITHDEEIGQEPKLDSETVKSTAAAWATWRQIRDAGDAKSEVAADAKPNEFAVPVSAPVESAAMAVAAGAEQILRQASAASEDRPSDVASIVDSVLADLRPKLMAEISRKISEKK
jgi:CheY-like chemotaxis protein